MSGPSQRLALVAIDRDHNSSRRLQHRAGDPAGDAQARRVSRPSSAPCVAGFTDDASLVLFGGMAKERPYPGSTTVTTVNGGVVGLTRTLVEELKPIRVNSIHPGVVGDSPYWAEKPAAIERYTSETPLGRLARMDEIVDAVVFLFENTAVNGVDLIVDGGWHTR